MREWNKIFNYKQLAEYLKVKEQSVKQYPKNKLDLMRFGFACKKLNIGYDDLLELSKNRIVESSKK